MSERAHTKGPWKARSGRIEAEGRLIASMLSANSRTTKEDKANARLIAAAPEMFEALIQAREWLQGWASAEPQLAIIEAALAKASTSPSGDPSHG